MKIFKPLRGNSITQELTDKGLLPVGTRRFIIDSGLPGEAMKIYWEGFANEDLIRALVEDKPLGEVKIADPSAPRS